MAKANEQRVAFKKLPQIEAKELHVGSATCSSATLRPSMGMHIGVGFGRANVSKDDEIVWIEELGGDEFDETRLSNIELMAKQDPDHDWRVVRSAPLHGETFQRHGDDFWVCIESNMGFA